MFLRRIVLPSLGKKEMEIYLERLETYQAMQFQRDKLIEKAFRQQMVRLHGTRVRRKHDRDPTVAQG